MLPLQGLGPAVVVSSESSRACRAAPLQELDVHISGARRDIRRHHDALMLKRLSLSCFCLQCNHRSWADFYLDVLMTEGHAQMLSRWAGHIFRETVV